MIEKSDFILKSTPQNNEITTLQQNINNVSKCYYLRKYESLNIPTYAQRDLLRLNFFFRWLTRPVSGLSTNDSAKFMVEYPFLIKLPYKQWLGMTDISWFSVDRSFRPILPPLKHLQYLFMLCQEVVWRTLNSSF